MLIDAGPILSSVEAAVLAQEVDGVIFVIGRGQQKSAVGRAIRRLDSLALALRGLYLIGLNPTTFCALAYGSSSHRSPAEVKPKKNGAASLADAGPLKDFGPLVRAVAAEQWRE